MSTVQDWMRQYFEIQGYTGTLNEQTVQWLQSLGATSDNINDAWVQMLSAQVVGGSGNRNDNWLAYLNAEGYTTGTVGDRELRFWEDLSSVGGPTVVAPIAAQTDDEGDTITALDVSATFTAGDNPITSYQLLNAPAGLSISSLGVITGTVGQIAGNASPYTASARAVDSDGKGISNPFTWTVNIIGPSASGSIAAQSDSEGDAVNLSVSSAFTSPRAVSGYGITGAPPGLSINSSGVISGTIGGTASILSPYSATVTLTDVNGRTATQAVTWNVAITQPTVATTIADQTDTDSATIAPLDVSGNFNLPTAVASWTLTGQPSGLTIDGTGTITGTLGATASGSSPYSTTVTVTDVNGRSASDSFTWTVNPAVAGTNEVAEVTVLSSQVSSDQTNFVVYVNLGDLAYPDWQSSTAYGVNDNIRPTVKNNRAYRVTTAGTSGGSEPTWPTTVGATVADGTAVWTCCKDFWSTVSSGGGDIRVFKADGMTECPREVVSCDTLTETGELHLRHTGLLSASSNTPIKIFADGTSADYAVTDPFGRDAVWSDYEAVYHFANGSLISSNGLANATVLSGSVAASSDAPFGENGITITTGELLGASVSQASGQVSATGWLKGTAAATANDDFDLAEGVFGDAEYKIWLDVNAGTQRFGVVDFDPTSVVYDANAAINTWHHVGGTISRTQLISYGNGAASPSASASGVTTNPYQLFIGGPATSTGSIKGFRLFDGVLSADWIATEYANQSDPNTFYTITATA